MVLNIPLEELITQMSEVTITARDKTEAINPMASVSARQFTIEESQRFAGARNDVARMATNYAGVSASNDATNEIVIRGNSPNGLLWKMEGVEIANPNHYGALGTSGGTVSMLNNNVLSNSDFYTGAFPSNYGNALSGVFDLRMRNGNNQKHEYIAQVGFNGFEAGIEGPFSKKSKSSFLVNYRYSTLALMGNLGFDFGTGTAIPYYQDLTWKAFFPTKNAGTFSFWGISGKSDIEFINSGSPKKEDDGLYGTDNLDVYNYNKSGSTGVSHQLRLGDKSLYKLSLTVNGSQNQSIVDSVDLVTRNPKSFVDEKYDLINYMAILNISTKISSRFNINYGAEARYSTYNLFQNRFLGNNKGMQINSTGNTSLYQAHIQGLYKFTDDLVLNAGLHDQFLALNNSNAIDPRFALQYQLTNQHSFKLAYGLHSQMQPIFVYFLNAKNEANETIQPNKNLDFTRSHHYVLSYDWNINRKIRFRSEVYYQQLFQAPVEKGIASSFSLLNNNRFNFEIPDALENTGTGTNKGIDLTLEQFLNHGFYYLATASIYNSEYTGSDGIKRSTTFNGGHTLNILGGYEFALKNKTDKPKKQWIDIDCKIAWAGGQRYTPLNVTQSAHDQQPVYDNTKAFSLQFDDYLRVDARIAYRIEAKKVSQEWVFDIQNISNHTNPLYVTFDTETGAEQIVNYLGFMPMMQYRITF